ncbi:ABC transporter substrate-binding protein [Isoptericola sp. BMS4]|uniref:ABC transporter substrate-binding protein n=1 Tax=Isoptericola sp. BMS4 TaxID=2527875 RepID=UPI00141F9490|nr:extracellular solute-binding protein [Isoptericola sp. BMS4]
MRRVQIIGAFGAVAALAVVGGCSSSGDDAAEGDGVTISVMGLPPDSKAEERQTFLDAVDAFEEANPDVTVEPSEYEFDAQTFSARLAGGNVDTVLRVPFTESQALIRRGQVADVTAEVDELEAGAALEPRILELMSDADGAVYGLPERAYAVGLLYNRDLFEQAGLDPDAPPATWDELREAATALQGVVDTPYAELTTNNQGGWHITMQTYSYGGTIEEQQGDEYVATFDNDRTVAALENLAELRWQDDVMGTQQLREQADTLRDFAAGDVGMWLGSPDVFNGYVNNFDGDPKAFGVGPMPQAGGDATLTGGWVTMVSADATDAERAAAVRWMDFKNLRQRYDADVAAEQAEADKDAGVAVGIPEVPLFDAETTQAVQDAIAPFATFPADNAASYVAGTADLEYVPEPAVAGQEIYSALDSVIQSVLSEEGADIQALLADAKEQAQAAIRRKG